MTQPSINFADGSFPVPQKSEIQELTEAVRDLAGAIRGGGRRLGPESPEEASETSLPDWEFDEYERADPEADTPWESGVEQVEALKLGYSDFTLPAVSRPEPEPDPVRHPAHYQMGGRECIEVTRDLDFCWGNVVKYLWRAPHKGNPVQDIEKALEYLELADWSKRPGDGKEGGPFDFFFDLCVEAPAGSAEELQLDALSAIFNPWCGGDRLRERIEDFRNHCLADERA